MNEELLPCPFCGKSEALLVQQTGSQWSVCCGNCGVETIWIDGEKAAIARWNRRAQRKPLKDALGPLRAWWAMNEAQWEICEETPADDAIILHFMGSGASTAVTAGQLRVALGIHPNRQAAHGIKDTP